MKSSVLILATGILLISATAFAAAPDTIQIGVDKAYLYSTGVIRIPVLLSNSVKTAAFLLPVTIETNGQPLKADSVSPAGRTTLPFQTSKFRSANHLAKTTDSVCLLVASDCTEGMPVGSGTVAEVWMTGAALGDQILFGEGTPDSLTGQFGVCWIDSVRAVDCDELLSIPVVQIPTHLTVVPAALNMTCPDSIAGQTAIPITLQVVLSGIDNSLQLHVESMIGPKGTVPGVSLSGNNPYQVLWTPPLYASGDYFLSLRGADNFGQTVLKTIKISVSSSSLSGDVDCNGVINLSDLARLVSFLTGSGHSPVCGAK